MRNVSSVIRVSKPSEIGGKVPHAGRVMNRVRSRTAPRIKAVNADDLHPLPSETVVT